MSISSGVFQYTKLQAGGLADIPYEAKKRYTLHIQTNHIDFVEETEIEDGDMVMTNDFSLPRNIIAQIFKQEPTITEIGESEEDNSDDDDDEQTSEMVIRNDDKVDNHDDDEDNDQNETADSNEGVQITGPIDDDSAETLVSVELIDLPRTIRKVFFKRAVERIPLYENQLGVQQDIETLEAIWGVQYGLPDTPNAPRLLKRNSQQDIKDEPCTPKKWKDF